MTFEHEPAIYLLGLLLPLAALLLLRLPKKRVELGSTLVWQKVFEKTAVHRMSRWMRVLVMILLEGLILAAIVLASAKVQWNPANDGPSTRRVLVIDRSARMSVQDGSATLMDRAKAIMRNLVDRDAGRQTMILGALKRPEVTTAWTSDPAVLAKAIDSLAPADVGCDLRKALEMAQSAADEHTEICLISDNTVGLNDYHLARGNVTFYPCRTNGKAENVGITRFDVQRDKHHKGQFHVLLALRGNADRPVDVPLEIRLGDRSLVKETINIPPGEPIYKQYALNDESAGQVKAVLHCKDALQCDNVAGAPLDGVYRGRVYLWSDQPDPFLIAALGVHSDIELFEIKTAKVLDVREMGNSGDILLFKKAVPPELPEGPNLVFINPQASNDLLTVQGRVELKGQRVQVKGDDALCRGVDWEGVAVGDAARVTVPAWARVVVESSGGVPLVLAGMRNGRKVAVITFDVSGTALATGRGYSILFSNLLSWMLNPPQNASPAPAAGLLDESQTMLQQQPAPAWLNEGTLAAAGPSRKNVWHILVLAAIALLPVEWFLYHYRYLE